MKASPHMADRRRTWPRLIRRVAQTATFLLFLAFVVYGAAIVARGGPADLVMRFSPLSGLGASLSAWTILAAFWPALLILAAAVVLGRWFCGWACPLGTTIDIGDKVTGAFRGKDALAAENVQAEAGKEPCRVSPSRRLKYYVLLACVLTAAAGLSAFAYLDPLSIAVRSYVVFVHAYVAYGLKALFDAFAAAPVVGGAAKAAAALLQDILQAQTQPEFTLHGTMALVLLGVLALGLIARRYWCRAVCPLGAMYALAGKWSLTARKVDASCIHCGLCRRVCPTGCISKDGAQTLAGECILCLNCQAVCPANAVRFVGATRDQLVEVDLSRRGALAAAAAAAITYPLVKIAPSRLAGKGGTFIRPPLAGRDEDAFLKKCLRCGQCMRVCPTQAIHPAGLEGGMESLWTPILVPRLGYCEYNCFSCGRACPSGAIPRFTLQEKHRTALGLAHFDQGRCIPWRGWQRRSEDGVNWDRHNCGVCEEMCPAPDKAIRFLPERMPNGQELRLPYVRAESCVGCGSCEYACPVQGVAAVRVAGGFRELPPPEKRPARASIGLPERVGEFRIAQPARVYEGDKQLFEYIDGAAEPYLKFGFVRVAAATYAAGAVSLRLDLWEFQAPDGAFGAYAHDRAEEGKPVEAGDEGVAAGAALWAWRGLYMAAVLPGGGPATAEQAAALAGGALESVGARSAARPEVCRRLPADGLAPNTVRYMLAPVHLQDLYVEDDVIETLHLDGKAKAAYGAYGKGAGGVPAGLVLVQYASEGQAEAARRAYAQLLSGKGHRAESGQGAELFTLGEGHFSAMGSAGTFFAVSLSVPGAERAVGLVLAALKGQ